MKRLLLALALAVIWVNPAAAQAPPPDPGATGTTAATTPPPAAAKKSGERNRGIMASLSFGVNGCTDDWCDDGDIEPMVYVRVHALFRIFKYFAAGLHMSFNFFHVDDREADRARYWQLHLAPEFRGIFPWKKFDFWTAITLGYVRDMAYADYGGGDDGRIWMNGFGIGWGIGAQYYIMNMLAVGADFWLYKGIYTRMCIDAPGVDDCDHLDADDRDDMDIGITWAVGITATFYWGL